MDYSKLSDFEINKLIAESLGNPSVTRVCDEISGSAVSYTVYKSSGLNREGFITLTPQKIKKDFCNNPADAWPIITENHIAVVPYQHTIPQAWPTAFGLVSKFTTEDRKPLRAAMITFLKMRDSKNAKIPSERDS